MEAAMSFQALRRASFLAAVGLFCAYFVALPFGIFPRPLQLHELISIGLVILVLALEPEVWSRIEQITFGRKGLRVQLTQLQKETETIRNIVAEETSSMGKLLATLVPVEEYTHLKHLTDDPEYEPQVYDTVKVEFRRLRGMGFLKSLEGKYLANMPNGKVKIREWLEPTTTGREYIQLRETYEQKLKKQ